MTFSPTTILGYIQALATAAILYKPLYLYYTVENYDAVSGLAAASAVCIAVNSLIAIVRGHLTADVKPNSPVE